MDSLIDNSEEVAGESFVRFRSSSGTAWKAPLLRASEGRVVFEVSAPEVPLRLSESLTGFEAIYPGQRHDYGRATVCALVETGSGAVCEVTIEAEQALVEPQPLESLVQNVARTFEDAFNACQREWLIPAEFRLVVCSLRDFLQALKAWAAQWEVQIGRMEGNERKLVEQQVVDSLQSPLDTSLGELFARFDEACPANGDQSAPFYKSYVRRLLHPLVLCAPFMHRTYTKPLGYAGDYQMVNMMVGDPIDGQTLFAKLLNAFFLRTPPVIAHRNRLKRLVEILINESATAVRLKRRLSVLSIGCGPAAELQEFIAVSRLSEDADLTLLDFNAETLAFVEDCLQREISRHDRRCSVRTVKKSVAQLLKDACRSGDVLGLAHYDLIYCAGLFDYLPDEMCRRLVEEFYRALRPGGLFVATNVASWNPSRKWMEYAVDWHLQHREPRNLEAWTPSNCDPSSVRVDSEVSGLNLFLEIRKTANG